MTEPFDLTVRGGRLSTANETFDADVGIIDGRIAAIAQTLPAGRRDINAQGLWVLPGGIDSHCHVDELSPFGMAVVDDFESATVSAAFGGTTTIIPFAVQHRGMRLPPVIGDYHQRALGRAVIDYAMHLIVTDPDEQTLSEHLPQAIRDGITSFKIYMTYDALKLDDGQILDILALAGEHGALVMVHAENHDMIRWLTRKLLAHGHTAPKFHAVAHDALAESEATNRAIALASLIDVPILIVHVAGIDALRVIHSAQTLGANILAESCPQYLFLTKNDLDQPGLEGAKYCCSPPPRDAASQEAVWQSLIDGTVQLFSSDHAPYRFDTSGKLPKGDQTRFDELANGLPGLELRLPLLFSEGVLGGRMSIERFVAVTATNHARTYGLYPRKGTLAVGSDADITIWDPNRETVIRAAHLHDRAGYTPYEGRAIKGWPVTVINRGCVIIEKNTLQVKPGAGLFLPCATPEPVVRQKLNGNPNAVIKRYFTPTPHADH
jgi:dihydropyrimidinase